MTVHITVRGRVGKDPELRFSPSGKAVAGFSMADSNRKKDPNTGEWYDANTSWYRVTAFGQLAENVAESLVKGDLAIVTGRLMEEEYEDRDGVKKRAWKLMADAVGVDLTFHPAKSGRMERGKSDAFTDDPWAS